MGVGILDIDEWRLRCTLEIIVGVECQWKWSNGQITPSSDDEILSSMNI